jgi:hypothetical protein
MNGPELPTLDEIIDELLVLLDELAKRLEPDDAVAVLKEHGFNVSSVDELRWLLNALRPQLRN